MVYPFLSYLFSEVIMVKYSSILISLIKGMNPCGLGGIIWSFGSSPEVIGCIPPSRSKGSGPGFAFPGLANPGGGRRLDIDCGSIIYFEPDRSGRNRIHLPSMNLSMVEVVRSGSKRGKPKNRKSLDRSPDPPIHLGAGVKFL